MQRFLTPRAVGVAALAIGAGAWAIQRVELVYGGPAMAAGVLPALPMVLLAALALLRSGAFKWLQVQPGELLAVYLMAAVGLPLASSGLVHGLLPGLVTGFYFFADEGGRYYPFLRHIPGWLVPGGSGSEAVNGFFEGGTGVPWAAWTGPLLAWGGLVAAFFLAVSGVAGLLRRRWLEEERLRFPVAELPLELMRRGRAFLADRLMWLGVLVPALLYGLGGLHHYLRVPGEIPLEFDLAEVLLEEPWRAMAPDTSRFVFSFSPLLVGLVYLMSVEVSFSTWFFFLLTRVQLLVVALIGRGEDHGRFVGLGGQWREWPNLCPYLSAQARGGVLAVALLSLWAGRRALGGAWRRARGGWGPERRAVLSLGIGLAMLVWWGRAAGLSLGLSLGYFAFVLLTAVGMSRLRVDGGLPVSGLYFLTANLFYFACGTGPGVFAPSEYVAFAFLSSLSYTGLGALLVMQLEGLKMAEVLGLEGRRVVLVLGLGAVLGFAAGSAAMLGLVYERGLFALDQQGGARAAARLGRYYHYLYAEAGTQSAPADWARLGAMGAGAAAVGVLAWLRQLFLRWPLHPLGFVYGTGLGGIIWGSALVGWCGKVLVVRYGGAGTYRRVRPFFLGMVAGELALRVLWAGLAGLGVPGGGYDW